MHDRVSAFFEGGLGEPVVSATRSTCAAREGLLEIL